MEIEKLKQKILDLAIRGKLVPQDPDDEPALVLIEKIRKEKEELIKQGKIKRDKNESYIYKGSDNCYYEKIVNNIKDISEEIPFQIPNSWSWVRLGTIFDIGSSKRVHKSDWTTSGIPFYRARDIELLNDDIFKSELYISQEFYNEIKNKYGIPKINDILVTAVGTLGKTYVVKDNNPFYYKDGNIICLSNVWNINPYFVQLLFQSSYIKKHLAKTEGTTVNTYTIINANKTLIPLPSLNEQKRIVDNFISFNSKIKNIINETIEINSLIDKLRLKVLDYFFSDSSCYKSYFMNIEKKELLNFIPSINVGDGDWVLSEDMDVNGEYKLIQLKHIGNNIYLNKPYNSVNYEFVSKNNCSIIEAETLLVNRLVSDKMNCCIVPKTEQKYITSVDVCWISKNDILNNEYLMYLLSSPSFQREVMNKCSGSTRKRISKKNLLNIKVNVHEYKYQLIIKDKINYIFKILDSLCV